MYMPKLGTMRLRNKFVLSRVVTGFLVLVLPVLVAAQTTAPPSSANQPPAVHGTNQQPNSAPLAQTPPPSQNPPAQASPNQTSPNQASPGQAPPTQAPSNQAPASPPAAGQPTPSQAQPPTEGQGPSATDSGVFVFRTQAQEVTLHATVVDERNRLVTNLSKPDFTVFENNQPQQIRTFRQEDFPVAMGIVIDNSGSMREKRDQVNKAALNLVRSSNPDDQVFVVNFNDEYYLDQEFTSDIKKLQAALEHVESRGGTALHDAIVASADYLMKSPLQRKVLFVVTDGEDDASQESLEQTVHRLQQENGPTVYAIGLLGGEKLRHAKRELEVLADRTGGIAFFPPTLNEVDEISRSVAHDIRNQYTITYAPTTPKNVGGFRTIHVDAHARPYKKLTVRTRSGYYPGQEKGAGGEP
jgi:Ca-activated chloride channel family protein